MHDFFEYVGYTIGLQDSGLFEARFSAAVTAALQAKADAAAGETRRTRGRHRTVAQRQRAGALRLCGFWRPRTPLLRLSAVRFEVPGSAAGASAETSDSMVQHISQHWGPIFRAPPTSERAAEEFCAQWARRWPDLDLLPPTPADFVQVARRAPRSAPGLDGLPYGVWRAAGLQGAEIRCDLTAAVIDGVAPPLGLNASLLVLLPKGSAPEDADGRVERAASNLRPLCLKNSDAKLIASTMSWCMRGRRAAGHTARSAASSGQENSPITPSRSMQSHG